MSEHQQDRGWTKNDQPHEPEPSRDATGRLLHYSDDPITAVESRDQRATPDHLRHYKPWGLWLSVEGEDDWRSWCESEQFGAPAKQLCYVVTLAAEANVLRLSCGADLLDFTDAYGFDPYDGRYSFAGNAIQWERVAALYDGIIIAPYIWTMRLEERVHWYYGWDCASGCIWNARAIARLSLIAPERPERAVVPAVDPSRSIPQKAEP